MDCAIRVRDLTKIYKIYSNPWHRLRERMPWGPDVLHRSVHALRDINFEVPRGICVGVVGGNGAGKSTLLKVLTGTTAPTSGSYSIRGRVAALLELGAGFNQAFTGRENIYMNAALMGFSRAEARAKYDQILDFSELHDAINAPLRTYSSGMICRLGFSVAVAVDPDVLIVDEILAVGDMHFRRKCVDRIMDYRDRGKTMFFCSHSLYDIRQICDETIWMKDGAVKLKGQSVMVTNEYATYENTLIAQPGDAIPWTEGRGRPMPRRAEANGRARIVSAELVDPETGEPRHVFGSHADVAVIVHLECGEVYEPLHLAVGFVRTDGTLCLVQTTAFDAKRIEADEAVVKLLLPKIKLLSGEFLVPVWLLDESQGSRLDEKSCATNLVIQNRDKELGLFLADRDWEVEVREPPPADSDQRLRT